LNTSNIQSPKHSAHQLSQNAVRWLGV
jgi:hypothetical protein